MYEIILMPTDGSKCSKKAAKHALYIADISNANIILLHVVDTHILRLGYAGFFKEDLYNMLMEAGKRVIEDFRKEIDIYGAKCSKNIRVITKIKDGEPYDEIVKTIEDEDIDLVVMGASGIRGIDRILLGSVTEKVVRKSRAPVLVVH
ncbi:universal stress protein [Methanobacterium sp. ACI-7]|uniref:universal stress protein n=1 Tax=unclassified Methanobacterium TaxID=2627676 RepID=UPI0039C02C79